MDDAFDFAAMDPDWDAVAPDLAALHGRTVKIATSENPEGEGADGMLWLYPSLFALARRMQEDDAGAA